MSSEKYIGLDVHQTTISVAVMDSRGKLVMESIVETRAATIVEFFAGMRGTLFVTFEEGTWAGWLYDLLKPRVAKLVVCNPRKNALLKQGNKSDRIDAYKLADLLRLNRLEAVYHGETGVRMLRELARSYLTIVKDLSRVMNRLKALYRSWAVPCAGRDVYYARHRSQWLGKIPDKAGPSLPSCFGQFSRIEVCRSCQFAIWRSQARMDGNIETSLAGTEAARRLTPSVPLFIFGY
jgi:transposase